MFVSTLILVIIINIIQTQSFESYPSIFSEPSAFKSETINQESDPGYRLPGGFEPEQYVVEITPYFEEERVKDAFTFDGTVKISVKPIKDGINKIVLHENVADILDVKVKDGNGQELKLSTEVPFERIKKYNFLVINLDEQETLINQAYYDIRVKFTGIISDNPKTRGLYRGSYKDYDGNIHWYVSSHFYPIHARQAFPCFDEPGYKSTFNIIVNRPANFSPTYSNMKIAKQMQIGDRIKEIFHTTPRMSTYLVSIHISEDFKVIADSKNFTQPFRVIARPHAKGQGDYAAKLGPKIIDTLVNYLGIDSYTIADNLNEDHISVPNLNTFGIESWGSAHYREDYLLYSETENSVEAKENVAQVLSQLIIEKWFGNLITCQWWDNTWINTGISSYLKFVVLEAIDKTLEIEDRQSIETKLALSYDSEASTTAMQHTVNNPSEVLKAFNTIAYEKSGAVFLMLKHFLSEYTFQKALNTLLIDSAYENAKPEDVYTAFEAAVRNQNSLPSDIDIISLMKSWIEQPGYPVINVITNPETGLITLKQERYFTDLTTTSLDQLWSIPISFTTGADPDWNNLIPTYVMTEKTMEIPTTPGEHWVIFNLQQKGFYRIFYDNRNWMAIINSLKKDLNSIHHLNRAQIVDDVFAFMISKKMPYDFGFQVIDFLHQETNYYVWSSAIAGFNILRKKFFFLSYLLEEFDHVIHTFLEKVISDVGYDVRDNDSHLTLKTRRDILKFACKIGHEGCTYDAVAKFKALRSTGDKVNPNLRDHVYCKGIHEGDYEDWKFLKQLWASSNNAAAKTEMFLSLGCTVSEKALKEYLEMLLKVSPSPSMFLYPIDVDKKNANRVLQFVKERVDHIRSIGVSVELLIEELAHRLNEQELNDMEQWLGDNEATISSEKEYKIGKNAVNSAREDLGKGTSNADKIITAAKESGIASVSALFRTFISNGVTLISRIYSEMPKS